MLNQHLPPNTICVFQFPSVASPGDMISYPDELSITTNKVIKKMLIALLIIHRNWKFLLPSAWLTILTALIPVLPDFDNLVHQQGEKEEYEWLESTYDDKICSYWVSWANRKTLIRYVWLPDILAIVPPIDEPVHTLERCNITVWTSHQIQSILWILVKYQLKKKTS